MKWIALGILALAPALQEREGDRIDDLIETLVSGDELDRDDAADELVRLRGKAREALLREHTKATSRDVRDRIERVILRIRAGTDEVSGEAADVSVEALDLRLEIGMVGKVGKRDVDEKRLQIRITLLLGTESPKDRKIALKKAEFITLERRIELIVKSSFAWKVEGGRSGKTTYNSLLKPDWKEGSLAIVALQFVSGGKKVRIRTPVSGVTVAK